MRVPITKDVDLAALSVELESALGRDVALSVRQPGQSDGKGNQLPGVLVLLDAATGEPLALADGAQGAVRDAIAAHAPPPVEKSPAEQLRDAVMAAATVAEVTAALGAYADQLVERERPRRRPGRR